MTPPDALSRRAFVGLLAAVAAGAGTSTVFQRPASATAPVGASGALGALGGDALVDDLAADAPLGFRSAIATRLSTLEAGAGIRPDAVDHEVVGFRELTLRRLQRLERLRGVEAPPQGDKTWRRWTMGRVEPLEAWLPAALRLPFYTHMPLSTSAPDHGPVLRQRIADGSCNGIFLYENAWTPLAPTPVLDSIVASGPPVPLLMSPKNVSDPVKLAAWMDYWAARPEWIPFVRVAYWQEFQGDFGGEGQPPISAWHDAVHTLADAADKVGIASVAHAETWHLHPVYQPEGGAARLVEFLAPVIRRLGGGVTWSLFIFGEQDTAVDYVGWMDDFMAANFPWSRYGVAAYGDAVPTELPADDPRRLARAARTGLTFAAMTRSRASYAGYYALPVGPNPTRNFWDDHVEREVVEALGGWTARLQVATGR